MGLRIKLISLVIGLIFLYFVFRSIKRNSFRPTYAILWISISFLLISIPIFEGFYKWFSVHIIGIIDARHIIYIGLIGFLLIFNFYLTIKISNMSDMIQEMLSHIAILQNAVEKLSGKSESENHALAQKENEVNP